MLVDGTFVELLDVIIDAGKNGERVTVLVECGSTHQYGDRLLKKKIAWLIYNSMIVSKLDALINTSRVFQGTHMLVSPSSTWTHGYNESKRHLFAKTQPIEGYTKDQNHNIEECQCMAYFYGMKPEDWVPLKEFIKCL